jgi:hypothetical protein
MASRNDDGTKIPLKKGLDNVRPNCYNTGAIEKSAKAKEIMLMRVMRVP